VNQGGGDGSLGSLCLHRVCARVCVCVCGCEREWMRERERERVCVQQGGDDGWLGSQYSFGDSQFVCCRSVLHQSIMLQQCVAVE